ncbi:MAG: Zn-ribbon domain-containing OB-fold protein [Candidatus Thermoplasmatota archaeon]|nr:Zn-ribbon domain-containing OB-fold protein [Candidatus Thermoplasmatota archaeon]
MVEYKGTAIKGEDIRTKVLAIEYKPVAKYCWSTGIAIGRFLKELKNGKIIGRKCNKCSRVTTPPRMFCEKCFRESDEWVYLKDTGTVNTFALSYIAFDTTKLEKPVIPAVIWLDGADNAGFLHILGEAEPKDVKIGMRVKAVWKEANERKGDITDIKYFKPLE